MLRLIRILVSVEVLEIYAPVVVCFGELGDRLAGSRSRRAPITQGVPGGMRKRIRGAFEIVCASRAVPVWNKPRVMGLIDLAEVPVPPSPFVASPSASGLAKPSSVLQCASSLSVLCVWLASSGHGPVGRMGRNECPPTFARALERLHDPWTVPHAHRPECFHYDRLGLPGGTEPMLETVGAFPSMPARFSIINPTRGVSRPPLNSSARERTLVP